MKRRTFLLGVGSAAVVSTGGCIGTIDKQRELNSGGTNAGGNGSTGGAGESTQMEFSIVSADAGPGPVNYDVSVTGSRLGATAIPNLEIAVENTGNESVSWSYTGQTGDLPLPQGVHTETGTLVVGLDEEIRNQLMETDSGCARVDQFVGADGIKNTTLDPGQRRKREYAVVGVDGELSGGCPKASTYRIEEELGDVGTWGFEFRLE
ncbi:hypothetical protein [Halegenticoccus soli]|uniref:hypothetical protein n=1 Tax=Halegenticoccus soli TaxID=1985678 RepID=UPI00117ABE09|nr:hypothetical protein [Halegenticoccus soli]